MSGYAGGLGEGSGLRPFGFGALKRSFFEAALERRRIMTGEYTGLVISLFALSRMWSSLSTGLGGEGKPGCSSSSKASSIFAAM